MKKLPLLLILMALISLQCAAQDVKPGTRPQTPIMGWSSWNNFHVNIDEKTIKSQADFMVSTGMKEAGYSYINIDDGYFGGRDAKGNLMVNLKKFPKGMKDLADYIHSKGLKAGIYSDAGINTCASRWDNDTIGSGCGLFGHDRKDLNLMLNQWGYDFIKIDWCGASWMELNEQTRYTSIGNTIRELKPTVVYNICRWQFPGDWATYLADSWRISGDIDNNFKSVMNIVDLNADLWKYATPGHVNDMDMLQVGRGMSYDEDKTHFTMWCMMDSPLLAGNDLRSMSKQTIEILTNKEIIALNQDPLVYQARRIIDNGDLEVWAKPLISTMSGTVAVALLNRSDKKESISFRLDSIGIRADQGYSMRDLWAKKDFKSSKDEQLSFEVPAHGVVVLKIVGIMKPFNVFQYKLK
jgi:alpha-galactosidase